LAKLWVLLAVGRRDNPVVNEGDQFVRRDDAVLVFVRKPLQAVQQLGGKDPMTMLFVHPFPGCASREHLDRPILRHAVEPLWRRALGGTRDHPLRGEPGIAGIHNKEDMLRGNPVAYTFDVLHRDGRAGQFGAVGILRQEKAFQPTMGQGLRLAVPGEEHEQAVVGPHASQLLIEPLFDGELGGLLVHEDKDMIARKAEGF
jgi:hypothetical protein